MAFEEYQTHLPKTKRLMADDRISLTKWYINLGGLDTKSEYLRIQYDTDTVQIRFIAGSKGNGYKVSYRADQYQMACRAFSQSGVLPTGLYKRVDTDDPFEYVFEFERPSQTWAK